MNSKTIYWLKVIAESLYVNPDQTIYTNSPDTYALLKKHFPSAKIVIVEIPRKTVLFVRRQ